jgi:hypothetical protein
MQELKDRLRHLSEEQRERIVAVMENSQPSDLDDLKEASEILGESCNSRRARRLAMRRANKKSKKWKKL